MLMRVPDDLADARQSCYFLGGTLRIAPCNHDLALGIFTVDATNGCPCVVIGGRSHSAGVQYDDLGFVQGTGPFQPACQKLLLDRSAVRLGCPATEILNVETWHPNIVT